MRHLFQSLEEPSLYSMKQSLYLINTERSSAVDDEREMHCTVRSPGGLFL